VTDVTTRRVTIVTVAPVMPVTDCHPPIGGELGPMKLNATGTDVPKGGE
jgi:hypothetical protein